MTIEEAYALLPDELKNEDDLENMDALIDKVASISKFSNREVATYLIKLIHWICGSGVGAGMRGL